MSDGAGRRSLLLHLTAARAERWLFALHRNRVGPTLSHVVVGACVFDYTDASAHLAGAIVQQATGKSLSANAEEELFAPLGIRRHEWLAHADGRSFGAYGLFLTPRDFLRFGQGALASITTERGVIPQDWMVRATSLHVEPPSDTEFGYGYLWWLAPDTNAFTAAGHGGQYAYVVPALEMVVVVTADPNSNQDEVSVQQSDVRELVQVLSTGARGT